MSEISSSKARGTRTEGAKWRKIEATIRSEIEQGILGMGDRLAPEPDLATRFGVHRLTVRQALGSLQAGGLISIEPGRGTFVRRSVVTYGTTHRLHFNQDLVGAQMPYTQRLVAASEESATKEVAAALEIRRGTKVILLEFQGVIDGVPVIYGFKYFPAARFSGLPAAFEATGSIVTAMETYGIGAFTRRSTELIVRHPTPKEARLLDQPVQDPVVETITVDVDDTGKVIAFGHTCFAAARVRFVLNP
jgi:GntR family phosphonate transport system transcriptional regulator